MYSAVIITIFDLYFYRLLTYIINIFQFFLAETLCSVIENTFDNLCFKTRFFLYPN